MHILYAHTVRHHRLFAKAASERSSGTLIKLPKIMQYKRKWEMNDRHGASTLYHFYYTIPLKSAQDIFHTFNP